MSTESLQERSNPKLNRMLWIGMLLPPFAWFGNQQVNYFLVEIVCIHKTNWAFHLSSALFFALTCFGFVLSWRHLTSSTKSLGEPDCSRVRFMSYLGIMMNLLFGLVILGQALPTWFLDPCVH